MSEPGIISSAGISASMLESVERVLGSMEPMELGELEAIESLDDTLEEIVEAIEPSELLELSSADEEHLEAALDRQEVYDEAPAGETVEAPPVAPKKEKAAKTPKAAKTATPKAARDIAALPAEVFQLTDGDTVDDTLKAIVIGTRPAQVKIAEKFDNLFLSLAAGKAPSVYIMDCFKALDAAGTITSTQLVNLIVGSTSSAGVNKGAGKDISTARSQTGQIMHLFDVVMIAQRTGQTLVLNRDSTLAARLRAL